MTSPPWKPTLGDQQPRFSVVIPKAACRACEDRFRCTGNTGGHGRHPTLMPRLLHEVQSRARRERQTPEWRRQYTMRAGCEASISETVRAHGIRTVATVASPRHTSNTSSPPPAPTPSGSADAYPGHDARPNAQSSEPFPATMRRARDLANEPTPRRITNSILSVECRRCVTRPWKINARVTAACCGRRSPTSLS
ncbi:transposase [Embleya sp. NPDC055664]